MTKKMKRFAISLIRSLSGRIAPIAYGPAKAAIDKMIRGAAEAERKSWQSCGYGVRVCHTVHIMFPRGMAVGNNVHIGSDCYLRADGGIQIGDNTHISRRVTIYSSDHLYDGDEPLPFGSKRKLREVVIGQNVWIGMNACILPGVTIGDGAIIGMGAVVARDVATNQIVGQPPIRILGTRDAAAVASAEARRDFSGVDGRRLSLEEIDRFLPQPRQAAPFIVFVVTTGRSGSSAVSRILDHHPKVSARHEPRLQIIRWSTLFARGDISASEIEVRLRRLFCDTAVVARGVVLVESDQKYFNLITLLSDILPESKFIWMTRRAEAVVASTFSRGWFSDSDQPAEGISDQIYWAWNAYRISGPDSGEICPGDWAKMDRFERNAWYWSFVNRTILEQLSSLARDRWMWVDVGEIGTRLPDILRFLNVPILDLAVTRENAANYPLHEANDWAEPQRQSYERHCAPLMAQIYEDRDFDLRAS